MNMYDIKTLQLISVRWWNASAYYGISLAAALSKAKYPTVTGGRPDSPPLRKARDYGLHRYTDINLESLNPSIVIKSLARLKKFARVEHIELINAHRAEDHSFGVAVKLSSRQALPVVRTVSDVRPPKDHRMNRWLHEKHTDHFIFSCRASFERYQQVWPIFEERSTVIFSAIDTGAFRPQNHYPELRKKLSIEEDDIVVAVIARLDPVKDHETFLRAAAIVSREIPRARFLICGEECNVSIADLRKIAGEEGILDRVSFLPRDDAKYPLKDLIGMTDIGVVSSNGSEVICRISTEFMAMGKPQVVTHINVLPEIIDHGKNGFVVPAEHPREMAGHILHLAKNSIMRKEMGITARQYAEQKFSYPVLVEKTLEVYEKVLRQYREESKR